MSTHDPNLHDDSSAPPAARRWRALMGVVPALLLLAVGLWEMFQAARAGHDVPGDDAWQQASALVRAHHRPGDLIVFAPAWIDPVGRRHLGDLLPIDMAARMDDARYGTLFEVSIRGAEAPETRGRTLDWSESVGGVRVRRWLRTPAVVVTDFVDLLARDRRAARVEGQARQRPRVALEEVGFEPHRCVRVQPRPDETVRVAFDDVRLGSSLVGYVGLADVFTRREHREPGRLQVFVDGQEIAALEFGVDDGWVRFAAETEPAEHAQVVFAATAVGERALERNICFAAEARK